MKKELIADVAPQQVRVAILEDDVICEYYVERPGRERLSGNIYKGRVTDVLPGMEAAFVDIGLERNGFLFAGDMAVDPDDLIVAEKTPPITAMVKKGQELVVQVLKDPVAGKGARITNHITLPARMVVLMPGVDYVGVSRRIDDEEERQRLRELAESLRRPGVGIIMRTVARGARREDVEEEITSLLTLHEHIRRSAEFAIAPKLIHRDSDLLLRAVRDLFSPDFERFLVSGEGAADKVRSIVEMLSPDLAPRVVDQDDGRDVFDALHLEGKLDKSLARKVWLKSGGYLIFDQTEALTVVDVNTGKYVGSQDLESTIYKTNLEAAAEIARQVRLRDIGGIIVIDFIDMLDQEHQKQLVATLEQALSRDRTRTNVQGITALGLVEMTRKKVQQRVLSTTHIACPYCGGSGTVLSAESVGLRILKELRQRRVGEEADGFDVWAHPQVVQWLEAEGQLDMGVTLNSSPNNHMEFYQIKATGT